MSVLVLEQRCQGPKSAWADWAVVRPLSSVQAVVGTKASRTWTAVATHVTTARVSILPKPFHVSQVAMFMKQQF